MENFEFDFDVYLFNDVSINGVFFLLFFVLLIFKKSALIPNAL